MRSEMESAMSESAWPVDPMQWSQQAMEFGMSAWMAWWQLSLHWMSGGMPGIAGMNELPPWMVWHNGTEQLG